MKWIVIVSTLFFVSCASQSKNTATAKAPAKTTVVKKAATATAGQAECKKGTDVRTVKAEKKDAGCEVIYSKTNETNVVATSMSGISYCEQVVNKIKTNLVNAGYACN